MNFNFNVNIGNIIQALTLVYVVIKSKDSQSIRDLTSHLINLSSRVASSSSEGLADPEDLEV
jgi:hypothetical protein